MTALYSPFHGPPSNLLSPEIISLSFVNLYTPSFKIPLTVQY